MRNSREQPGTPRPRAGSPRPRLSTAVATQQRPRCFATGAARDRLEPLTVGWFSRPSMREIAAFSARPAASSAEFRTTGFRHNNARSSNYAGLRRVPRTCDRTRGDESEIVPARPAAPPSKNVEVTP